MTRKWLQKWLGRVWKHDSIHQIKKKMQLAQVTGCAWTWCVWHQSLKLHGINRETTTTPEFTDTGDKGASHAEEWNVLFFLRKCPKAGGTSSLAYLPLYLCNKIVQQVFFGISNVCLFYFLTCICKCIDIV